MNDQTKTFLADNLGHIAAVLMVVTKFIGIFGPISIQVGVGQFSVPHVEASDFLQTVFHMGFLSAIWHRMGQVKAATSPPAGK